MSNEIDMDGALTMMQRYGGGFVKNLAVAWLHADAENSRKLAEAFPGYLATYADMAAKARADGSLL